MKRSFLDKWKLSLAAFPDEQGINPVTHSALKLLHTRNCPRYIYEFYEKQQRCPPKADIIIPKQEKNNTGIVN